MEKEFKGFKFKDFKSGKILADSPDGDKVVELCGRLRDVVNNGDYSIRQVATAYTNMACIVMAEAIAAGEMTLRDSTHGLAKCMSRNIIAQAKESPDLRDSFQQQLVSQAKEDPIWMLVMLSAIVKAKAKRDARRDAEEDRQKGGDYDAY